MTFDQALDAYTNALVVAVVDGGGRQPADLVDRRAQGARADLLKLHKEAARAESKAVRELEKRVELLEKKLARVRRVVASEE